MLFEQTLFEQMSFEQTLFELMLFDTVPTGVSEFKHSNKTCVSSWLRKKPLCKLAFQKF